MKVILALVLLLTFFSSAKSQSKNVTRFIDEYQAVSHPNLNGIILSTIKWEETDTLKYKIIEELVSMPDKSLKKYLLKIKILTGITFIETGNLEKTDITMFFGDIKAYFQYANIDVPNILTTKHDSWYHRKYNRNKQLINASFCVDPKKSKTPDRCRFNFKTGLLKSIGLSGKLDDEYSLFFKYNTKNNLRLSKNDKRIIKLHYNSSIQAGMSVSESKEILIENIDIESLLKQKL